jgi:hypothetical protein
MECLNFSTTVNPNSARTHFLKGTVLAFIGNPSEARKAMSAGIRLNPRDFRIAMYYLIQVALSYYLEGDYAQAAGTARRAPSSVMSLFLIRTAGWRRPLVSSAKPMRHARHFATRSKCHHNLFKCMCAIGRAGFEPRITNTCWTDCARQVGRADIRFVPAVRPSRWLRLFAE